MKEQFGLFVTYSQMHTLELPALRDILAGSVGIFNNYNLCHVRSIDWEEIITGKIQQSFPLPLTYVVQKNSPLFYPRFNNMAVEARQETFPQPIAT